ncbi:MAG: oligosaccharide flippase family protein [Bdellovibrionales bacterium]|nr:oligosaccharide flippase family protein [Bdellovibrionales bacterium]
MSAGSARLLSGSAKLVGANVFLMFTAYIALLGIARLTDIERFGRYVVVVAVLLWLERVTAETFKHPLIRQITSGSWSGVQRILRIQIFVGLCIVLLLMLLAPYAAGLLNNPLLTQPLRVAALDILPFAAYASGVAALTAYDRFGTNALAGCVYGAAKLVLMLWAASSTGAVEIIVLGMVGASLLAAVFVGAAIRSAGIASDLRERLSDSEQAQVGHGYWCALAIVGGSGILLAGDVWLVQAFSQNERVVGLYGAAHNLTKAMYMAGSALMWPMIPAVSKAQGIRAAVIQQPQVRTVAALLVAGLLFMSALFAFGGGWLLALLFGAEFSAGGAYLSALAPAHLCVTLALVASQLNYHSGRPLVSAWIVIVGSLLFLTVGALCAARYGETAVPWSLCLAGAGMLTAVLISIFKGEAA